MIFFCYNKKKEDNILQQQALKTSYAQKLKLELIRNKFGALTLKDDNEKTCFYTGLESYSLFLGVFKLLQPIMKQNRCTSNTFSLLDELFLVLVKLRLAIPNADLAYRMGISQSSVTRIFHSWITVMSTELRCLIKWPDEETLQKNMPNSFKKHFSRVRCIIDCFEVFIERPVSFQARALTYRKVIH